MILKKKGLLALLLMQCAGGLNIAEAQTIKAGVNASSAAAASGTSNVNYSSGVMNYSIPLTQISQNGISIPIGLSYSATGIKVEQQPTTVGLGWAISGLGLVSRSIRGGIADEDAAHGGILMNPIPSGGTPYSEHVTKVNARKADGESDIFTLSYQNLFARFILEMKNGVISALQLDKGNLQITVEHTGYILNGFKVVDEHGNSYYFRDVEKLVSFYKPNHFTVNHTYLEQKPSAWYLSEIRTYTGETAKFEYAADIISERFSSEEARYEKFGRPLEEVAKNLVIKHQIDSVLQVLEGYDSFADLYREAINTAKQFTNNLQNAFQLETLEYSENLAREMDGLSEGTLGQMTEFQKEQVFKYYNQDIQRYEHNKNMDSALSRTFFNQTLNITMANNLETISQDLHNLLKSYYETVTYTPSRSSYNSAESFSRVLLIRKIKLKNQTIFFDYDINNYYSYKTSYLKRICTIDAKNDTIGEVRLKYLTQTLMGEDKHLGLLQDVVIKSPGSTDSTKFSLDYFDQYTHILTNSTAKDYWGFYNGKENAGLIPGHHVYDNPAEDLFYNPYAIREAASADMLEMIGDRRADSILAATRTLRAVTLPTGGKISFEYESNTAYRGESGPGGAPINIRTGGIRIKKVIQDNGEGVKDSVLYKYEFPVAGINSPLLSTGRVTTLNKKSFTIEAAFSGSTDRLFSSSPYDLSPDVTASGNEDVLYHYVEEYKPGLGKTGYKYFSYAEGPYQNIHDAQYHWLDGLLLAKAVYNNEGRLLTLDKNKYLIASTDLPAFSGNKPEDYTLLADCFFENNQYGYDTTRRQIRPFPMYYDEQAYLDVFPNEGQLVKNSSDPAEQIFYNPYHSYYVPNIIPRFGIASPTFTYNIRIGGKVLLKESAQYVFSDHAPKVLTSPFSRSDAPYYYEWYLQGSSVNNLANKTILYYDNAGHTYPSRTETVLSDGRKSMVRTKYAADYNTTGDEIAALKAGNRLAETIEQQQWLYDSSAGKWKLTGASISEYDEVTDGARLFHVPVAVYATELTNPIEAGTNNWSQTYNQNPPYSSVFHESKLVFRKQSENQWKIYDWGIALAGNISQNGSVLKAVGNDVYSGKASAEFTNAEAKDVLCLDLLFLQEINQKYSINLYKSVIDTEMDFSYILFTGSPDNYDYPGFARKMLDKFAEFQLADGGVWGQAIADTFFNNVYDMIFVLGKKLGYSQYKPLLDSFLVRYSSLSTLDMDTLAGYCTGYINFKSLCSFLYTTSAYLQHEFKYGEIDQVPDIYFPYADGTYRFRVDVSNYKITGNRIRVMGKKFTGLNYTVHYLNTTSTVNRSVSAAIDAGGIGTAYIDVKDFSDWQNAAYISFTLAPGAWNAVDNLVFSPDISQFEYTSTSADKTTKYVFNERGDQVNYFYDQNKRLRYVSDKLGHVMKFFCYNLSGQQENCRVYYNTEISVTRTRNNCGVNYTGGSYTYTVPAGRYPGLTQAAADALAELDYVQNAQAAANLHGSCTPVVYYNIEKAGSFTRNNCGSGAVGSSVVYTVPAGTYSSSVSQADANQKAQDAVTANGQAYANTNGTCTPVYWNTAFSYLYHYQGCPTGYRGDPYTHSVSAGTHQSSISVADANNKASTYWQTQAEAYFVTYPSRCHKKLYATLSYENTYTDWYTGDEYGDIYVSFFEDEYLSVPADPSYSLLVMFAFQYMDATSLTPLGPPTTSAPSFWANSSFSMLASGVQLLDAYNNIRIQYLIAPENIAQIYTPVQP